MFHLDSQTKLIKYLFSSKCYTIKLNTTVFMQLTCGQLTTVLNMTAGNASTMQCQGDASVASNRNSTMYRTRLWQLNYLYVMRRCLSVCFVHFNRYLLTVCCCSSTEVDIQANNWLFAALLGHYCVTTNFDTFWYHCYLFSSSDWFCLFFFVLIYMK